MLDVTCNTGRNIGRLGVVLGEERGGPLMLDVTRNMLATRLTTLLDGLSI
jgi:hypothetical protein